MALRATPTIAICLTAGLAAGIALARPDTDPAPTAAAPAVASAAAEITIEGFAFAGAAPASPGVAVTVTNLDGAPHTLTAGDGSFDTGTLNQNEAATLVAPSTPGTYEYFCAIHPSMVGTLSVG